MVGQKNNGKGVVFFFSPVQEIDRSIFSHPRVGSSLWQCLMTETGTLSEMSL